MVHNSLNIYHGLSWFTMVHNSLNIYHGLLWFTMVHNSLNIRGVIDIGHIDISITLLKQYSLLSLVNTYRNVSKYQKHENGHLEKKFRAEYC